MATALQLQAEIAGDERAIRHLIGERDALTSQIKRLGAQEKLLQAQLHRITTRGHPVVRPPAPGYPHGDRFPDVSNWQPHVDFTAVRVGHSLKLGALAVTKISEGVNSTDTYGAQRLRDMAAAGFPHRGAYHFLRPEVSPVAQAEHFLEQAHQHGVVIRDTDVLVCDAEISDGQNAATVKACVREFGAYVEAHAPARRWLYSGGPFAHENGITLDGYQAHWLAAYVGDPAPYMVFGRPRTIAWQYTDGKWGPVPHVCPGVGACDMSILL